MMVQHSLQGSRNQQQQQGSRLAPLRLVLLLLKGRLLGAQYVQCAQ
jgi:hypothetical protein